MFILCYYSNIFLAQILFPTVLNSLSYKVPNLTEIGATFTVGKMFWSPGQWSKFNFGDLKIKKIMKSENLKAPFQTLYYQINLYVKMVLKNDQSYKFS